MSPNTVHATVQREHMANMPFWNYVVGGARGHQNSSSSSSDSNSSHSNHSSSSDGGGGVTVTRALQLISSICWLKYNVLKTSCLAD